MYVNVVSAVVTVTVSLVICFISVELMKKKLYLIVLLDLY